MTGATNACIFDSKAAFEQWFVALARACRRIFWYECQQIEMAQRIVPESGALPRQGEIGLGRKMHQLGTQQV
jgi:hypothetical protein